MRVVESGLWGLANLYLNRQFGCEKFRRFLLSGGLNMLIKTSIEMSVALYLDAYTYDEREFAALERTLRSASIGAEYLTLERDEHGREGRRYTATSSQIPDLQKILEGEFDARGQFAPWLASGKTYACRQLVRSGAGPGCQELVALDDYVATTKCAIIAGNNKWWGGVAQPGTCSKKIGLRANIWSRT